jgi:hypothetical protein
MMILIFTIFESILLPSSWYICREIYTRSIINITNNHIKCNDGNFINFSLYVNGCVALSSIIIFFIALVFAWVISWICDIDKELNSSDVLE